MVYFIAKWLITPFALVLMRAKISGWRNLFRNGPMIIVSNHIVAMDPVLLGIVCPRTIRFMAKSELFQNRMIDFILRKLLLCFPVDREGMGLSSLKQAMFVLEKGKVFGIFPEGRRTVTGNLDVLEKGAAFLALRSGATVIPVWVDPKGAKRFKIHMRVGDPINAKEVADRYSGKAVEVVTREITNSFIKLSLEMENE